MLLCKKKNYEWALNIYFEVNLVPITNLMYYHYSYQLNTTSSVHDSTTVQYIRLLCTSLPFFFHFTTCTYAEWGHRQSDRRTDRVTNTQTDPHHWCFLKLQQIG